ncbi:MAG: T9SS type A sorting domain-containing protein [Flavobacteriales bacterium]|nr:T9SS type A sorting domain-containing protein [Flavobacteriales bacterium]
MNMSCFRPRSHGLLRNLTAFAFAALLAPLAQAQTLQPDWPQPNGPVFSTVVYGDTLIIGGEFSFVGSSARSHFAAFNAVTGELLPWAPFIFGTNSRVNHLQVVGDTLFVGGHFGRIIGPGLSIGNSNIAAYDLNTGGILPFWSSGTWVPPLYDFELGEVFTFEVYGSDIHIAGRFIGVQPDGPGLGNPVTFRNNFAVLNMQDETVYPVGSFDGALFYSGEVITSVKTIGDRFLIGGTFTQLAASERDNLMMVNKYDHVFPNWDAQPDPVTYADTALLAYQNWSPLRNVLGTWNERFIVSGDFDHLRGQLCGHLAMVDTIIGAPLMSWQTNVDGRVNAIAIEGNTGYICGDFTHVGGEPRNGMAAVDMTTGVVQPWAPPAAPWTRLKSISVHDGFIFVGNGIAPPYLLAYARHPTTGPLPNGICSSFPLNVTFSANNTYNAGNAFTAELSDWLGSFSSPVAIGSLASITSGTIPCVIPLNTPEGTSYRVRVRSSDPPLIGDYHLPSMIVQASSAWYTDVDGDGYGDPGDVVYDCQYVAGRILDGTDDCPALPGRVGTPCNDNDFFTFGDSIRAGCVCRGGRYVELSATTDANGSQTTWEILSEEGSTVMRSGPASAYTDNADNSEWIYLPIACYRLRVYDAGGDGIVSGGYSLRDPVYGGSFIDNVGNGGFGSLSAISDGGTFCMDIGLDRLIENQVDKETWVIGDQMIAHQNGAVSAQFGIGDQTDDGYQFWFFDPNGSYSRRVFRSHATSGGYGPANAIRACRLALASLVTQPIPANVLLNVKVRAKVNGVFGLWGAATRFRLLLAATNCPITQLTNSAPHFSCGSTLNLNGSDKVWAVPVTRPNGSGGVQVANRYRFEWSNIGEGYLRNIVSTSPALILSVWATNPLIPCRYYDVRVQASFDAGTTWCPWGPSCSVHIVSSNCEDLVGGGDRSMSILDGAEGILLYPNPSTGQHFTVAFKEAFAEDARITVDVLDLTGHLVTSTALHATTDRANYELVLDEPLSTGSYLARVSSDGVVRQTLRFGVVR